MKCYLIALIPFVIFALSQAAPVSDQYIEDMKHRKAISLECINQVHIDRSIVEEAMNNPKNLPKDVKYKEFLACSYKKQKFQSADGKMLFDNLYDFLARFYDRKDLRILDNCKNVTATNDGERAFNTLNCVIPYLYELDSKED